MQLTEFFEQKGAHAAEGSRPLALDDPAAVWIVEGGGASVFLTDRATDGGPGERAFLFEAAPGELLFGLPGVGESGREPFLMAVGRAGARLLRIDVRGLWEGSSTGLLDETNRKAEGWLEHLRACGGECGEAPREMLFDPAFLYDPERRAAGHQEMLRAIIARRREQRQSEIRRLQARETRDSGIMNAALGRLAVQERKKKASDPRQLSGAPLLDACRLIGEAMQIQITAPTREKGEAPTLEAIARASHIRLREVSLKEDWYRQDGGPLLGFLGEDGNPVALLPSSPASYTLHDPKRADPQTVDRKTASRLQRWGYTFFRPFESRAIGLRDLLAFSLQSSWKRDLATVVAMGLLGGMLGTAIPLATGIVFGSVIPSGDKSALLQIAVILGACAVASMLFALTRSLAVLRLEGKVDGAVQAAVWDRLLSLPVPFFQRYSAGELAMRAMGISHIRMILSGTTLNTILSGIFSVFTFALLFYYHAGLAAAAALLAVFAALVMAFLGYRKVILERQILDISNRISGLLLQLMGGVAKFRVAGAENRAFSRWAQEFAPQRQLTLRREKVNRALGIFIELLPVLSGAAIFSALAASASPLPPGQFVGFYSAFTTFLLSMASLSDSLICAGLVIPLYQRAKPILETLPEDDQAKAAPKAVAGAIEVSHVSFRYQAGGPQILSDISFQVSPGDYVAVVGASGCGKSTLLRILLGFETPETGKVYYDGQDLSKVDVRTVRRQIGVVLQNSQLMMGNLLDNIIGQNPRLTVDDAWEAAAMAGIAQDIREMPMGMHTVVSEGTGTISGGQKQRLMIARAIVNKPKLLFFDEATSALDNRTQAIVSQSLDALQTTRIIVAHRLSTILHCNKILVMDRGRIVESGTYEELMSHQGVFADLAKRQML